MYCSWNTKSGGLTVVGVESEMVQNLIYESIVWNELMSTFFRLHGYYMLVPENNEISLGESFQDLKRGWNNCLISSGNYINNQYNCTISNIVPGRRLTQRWKYSLILNCAWDSRTRDFPISSFVLFPSRTNHSFGFRILSFFVMVSAHELGYFFM